MLTFVRNHLGQLLAIAGSATSVIANSIVYYNTHAIISDVAAAVCGAFLGAVIADLVNTVRMERKIEAAHRETVRRNQVRLDEWATILSDQKAGTR